MISYFLLKVKKFYNVEEFEIINKYFKILTNNSNAAANLEDDVAKIKVPANQELVVSKDLMVEDVHFLKKDGGYKIAAKLLRSNLSDIAASGAKPVYYMLGFSKNDDIDENFIRDFALGLRDTQEEFGICLIGGDTVKSDKKLVFSITIFGYIQKNKILARNKAAAGDLICVSGYIGDAYLGLRLAHTLPGRGLLTPSITFESSKLRLMVDDMNIKEGVNRPLPGSEGGDNKREHKDDASKSYISDIKHKDYLLKRHYFPTPRINFARNLIKNNLSSAAIDVSDGLIADLNHICQASKVAAIIYKNKIPLSKAAKIFLEHNQETNFTDLIAGGDDYELIFSIKAKNLAKVMKLAKKSKILVSCIGSFKEIDASKKQNSKLLVELYDEDGNKIKILKYGYQH
jgi:thiamine-monophosphate kinase